MTASPTQAHGPQRCARGVLRMRLWLGVGVVAVAAVAATGAFGSSSAGPITTIAGTGTAGFSGDGGPAKRAKLDGPQSVALDRQGNVYILDARNNRVRRVSPGGKITTIAGGGKGDLNAGDGGPATSAVLTLPDTVAVDTRGNVYIAGEANVVRKVSRGGTISKFAGRYPEDPAALPLPIPCGSDGGPATSAELLTPFGMAVDARGNVYIAEADGYRVRKVSPSGTITTIAGTGKFGFSGDGGPATSARLKNPQDVAVDGKGNVYIADSADNRVRKVSPGGRITTFAGTGKRGFSGDGGRATRAKLSTPSGIAIDGNDNVYIADYSNARVRKVSPSGKITTIAGTGDGISRGYGFSGDGGPAIRAQLNGPDDVAVDGKGNVYIADRGNERVRMVRG